MQFNPFFYDISQILYLITHLWMLCLIWDLKIEWLINSGMRSKWIKSEIVWFRGKDPYLVYMWSIWCTLIFSVMLKMSLDIFFKI